MILRRSFARFLAVGALGFVADAAVTVWLYETLGIPPLAARGLGFLTASASTYLLNRSWTFASGERDRGYAAYAAATGAGALLNYVAFAFIVHGPGHTIEVIVTAVAAGSLAGLTVNYLLASTLVFPFPRNGASR